MITPYRSLDVVYGGNKVDGFRAFVRDKEEEHFYLVEYVGKPGRLTCYCPDGEAHAESPDTEPACVHLRAVVDQRAADNAAAGPKLGVIRPSAFVD